jgi:hypothetical protein
MSATDDARQEILSEIQRVLSYDGPYLTKAAAVKNLAEAWAWLMSPGQSHGSSPGTEATR